MVRLSCHIHGTGGRGHMYELRRRLNNVLSPMLGPGRLVYENSFGAFSIPAFCARSSYSGRIRDVQTLDVSFECPQPFWEAAEVSVISLAYVEGGLEFPLETPTLFGTLGYRDFVQNDGDVSAPVAITMDGGAINPVIENVTTGEFIRFTQHVPIHDKIYINTDPERLSVSLLSLNPATNEYEGANAFGFLTDDSTLWRLVPGVNIITFRSDDENKMIRIRIEFSRRFAGV